MFQNYDVPFLIPENFKNLDLKIPKIIFLEMERHESYHF